MTASCPCGVTTHAAKADSSFLAISFVFADNFESTTEYLLTEGATGTGVDAALNLVTVGLLEVNSPHTLFCIFLKVVLIVSCANLHLASLQLTSLM